MSGNVEHVEPVTKPIAKQLPLEVTTDHMKNVPAT